MRFFNTEGPIRPDRHYCLAPLHRWNLEEVMELIDQEKYWLESADGFVPPAGHNRYRATASGAGAPRGPRPCRA
jgi:hypothetical protein